MNHEWRVLFQPKKTVSAGTITITISPTNHLIVEVYAIRIKNRNASDRTLTSIEFLGMPIIENHSIPTGEEVRLPNDDVLATFNKYKGPMNITENSSAVVTFDTTQVDEFFDVYFWYRTNIVGDIIITLSANATWVNPLTSAIPVHEGVLK